MLAVVAVPANVGYLLLALLIGGESAGIPLPGETALVAAAALASQGKLDIALVVGVAAAAAIVGDNIGYLIGRRGLRWIAEHPAPWARHTVRLIARGEVFFTRHGGKTVFFGRWLPVLRITAAWLAGAHRMPWRRFALFNALGGVCWATTVGVLAYVVGQSAGSLVSAFGLLGVAGVTVSVAGHLILRRLERRSASGDVDR
ncbi:MAG TPA: DedA family protein [Gaiellales bacterium]|nr:DedA family protein [Gaiellales bacterium]